MREAKGKHGGKRQGAGRKPGSKNALAYGEVRAVKAAGLRVPQGAEPAVRELADRALQRVAAVMEGKVHYLDASAVLKAATRIREEVCGPIPQKLEHAGADGGPIVVEIKKESANEAGPGAVAVGGAGPGQPG